MARIRPGEYFDGQESDEFYDGQASAAVGPRATTQPMVNPQFLESMAAQITQVTKAVIRQGKLIQILTDAEEYKKANERIDAEDAAKAAQDPRVDHLMKVVTGMAEQFNKLSSALPSMIGEAVRVNLEQSGVAPVQDFAGEIAEELASTVTPMRAPKQERKSGMGGRKPAPVAAATTSSPNRGQDNGKSEVIADGMERELH